MSNGNLLQVDWRQKMCDRQTYNLFEHYFKIMQIIPTQLYFCFFHSLAIHTHTGCRSTRGQTKSRTTESRTRQFTDWTTRGLCTGQLADWLKFPFFL